MANIKSLLPAAKAAEAAARAWSIFASNSNSFASLNLLIAISAASVSSGNLTRRSSRLVTEARATGPRPSKALTASPTALPAKFLKTLA